MMMNWKGFGSKRSWPNFKVLSWNSPGGTVEYHEKTQSGKPVAGAENRTRDLLNTKRSVNHSTTTFGPCYVDIHFGDPQ
jgi:hypothetical protein